LNFDLIDRFFEQNRLFLSLILSSVTSFKKTNVKLNPNFIVLELLIVVFCSNPHMNPNGVILFWT